MTEVTRCEACGKIATHGERVGWIYLGVRRPPEPAGSYPAGSYLARALGAESRPAAAFRDLCSWECVRDYAVLQALDPQPVKGEESA